MRTDRLYEAQPQVVHTILNSYNKDKLSHAYIFEGDAGTMKFDAALFFAALLLCTSEEGGKPCFSCSACRRVEHLTHPNLRVVRPEKDKILKGAIQSIHEEVSKTALEDGAKLYIIESAEKMNPHASNALLKLLEEPHSKTYALLLAEDEALLLPTIQSRAQTVRFHPLPKATIEQMLIDEGYPLMLSRLASSHESTPEEARALLEEKDIETLLDAVFAVYEALENDASPITVFNQEAGDIVRDRETASLLLNLFIYYQKDLIYGKIDNRNQIIFTDAIETIERLEERFTLETLTRIFEQMLTIKERQKNYINMRLAFDNVMLALERGLSDGT